ncbi:MAG: NfeD family protein [Clostridia bacterium]|nr:NfeD family protein [Clostridia bacterium]
MDYMPYLWIAVMIIMAVFEGVTTQLVSIWFMIGAAAAAIVSFFVPVFPIQFSIFVGVSLILLIATKPIVKKVKDVKTEPTNADRNIGKIAVVTAEINNTASTGQVDLDGNSWTARSDQNEIIFKEGEMVRVKEIKGVKLIVSKV